MRRAPIAAQSPIGPRANTATVSPTRTPPFSAPANPVDMMSGHISTCSSVRFAGTGERLTIASGTRTNSAWQPSIVLPNRQPPAWLEAMRLRRRPANAAAQTGVAVSARRDGAGDDPLPFAIADDLRAQLLDDADGLMADDQAFANRIFAAQDMDVGAANRRRADTRTSASSGPTSGTARIRERSCRALRRSPPSSWASVVLSGFQLRPARKLRKGGGDLF